MKYQANFLSTLLAHKSVRVPIHSVCAFLVAAHDAGLIVLGGAFDIIDNEISSQYFYL